ALATRPRARSTSARLASRSTWLFSTSPRAICWSVSFFVFGGQGAIGGAAPRAARARVSMRILGSIVIPEFPGAPRTAGPQPRDGLQRAPPSSENHQIVAVDHFVEALVAESVLDLLRLHPAALAELSRVEVHDSPGELLAAGAPQESHHLPRVEVPLDLDYA